LLLADVDPARAVAARRSLDVVGHYARPDIFTLHVDRRVQRPAVFRDEEPER
jgi:nitrilase